MARYLLHHRHEPDECGVAGDHQMAFYGDPSPRLIALVNKIGVDAKWFAILQVLEPAGAH